MGRPCYSQDVAWATVSALIVIGPLGKAWKATGEAPLHLVLLSIFIGPTLSAGVIFLATYRPSLYWRCRTPLLSCLKLIRFATAVLFLRVLHFEALLPVPQEGSLWSLLMLPGHKGIVLLITGFGFQLPLSVSLWIQAAGLVAYASTDPARCAYECPAAHHVAQFYEAAARQLHSMANWVAMPPVVGWRRDTLPQGEAACVLVQFWAQALLGFVLPALCLAWNQGTVAPGEWYPGCKRATREARSVLLFLFMFLLAGVTTWRVLELGLWAWPQAQPA